MLLDGLLLLFRTNQLVCSNSEVHYYSKYSKSGCPDGSVLDSDHHTISYLACSTEYHTVISLRCLSYPSDSRQFAVQQRVCTLTAETSQPRGLRVRNVTPFRYEARDANLMICMG